MNRVRYYNPNQLTDDEVVAGFIARQRELADIVDVIRNQPTSGPLQHMLILGERGMGKTTLGRRALIAVARDADLGQVWQPVGFAEESYRVTSLGKFWLEALAHLSLATGEAKWQERADDLRRNERDDDRMAARARDLLTEFRQESGRRPILFVENIDEIFDQFGDKQDSARLRADLQSRDDFMIIGTATARFAGIDDYGKPFYQFFRLLNLKGLDHAAALEVVDGLAIQLECPALSRVEQSALGRISAIRTITGGNPRLLHLTARLVAQSPTGTAMEDLERLVDEQTPYFKAKVDALPAQQREIIQALAGLWEPATAAEVATLVRLSPSQVSAQLRKLEESGFVVNLDKEKKTRAKFYEISARMYSLYFSIRAKNTKSEKIKNLIDFLVNLYGETAGRSILKAVMSRILHSTEDCIEEDYITISESIKFDNSNDLWDIISASGRMRFRLISKKISPEFNKKRIEFIADSRADIFYSLFLFIDSILRDIDNNFDARKIIPNLFNFENEFPTEFINCIKSMTIFWEISLSKINAIEALDAMKKNRVEKLEPLYLLLQQEAGIDVPHQALELRNAIAEVKLRRERLRNGESPLQVFSAPALTPV